MGLWTFAVGEMMADYESPELADDTWRFTGDTMAIANSPDGGLVTRGHSGPIPLAIDGDTARAPAGFMQDGPDPDTDYRLDHFILTRLSERTVLLESESTIDPFGDDNNMTLVYSGILVR